MSKLELYNKILAVCEANSSFCMDEEDERHRLTGAIAAELENLRHENERLHRAVQNLGGRI